jgi:hypothetical protein
MASFADRIEARRAERRRANAPSTLRASETGPVDTFVHDISATGAKISCDAELLIGDFVSIGLTGVGAVRAIVVWRRTHDYGLDFLIPLTPEQIDRAFADGSVVSLAPPRPTRALSDLDVDPEEEGIYAEASGWLSMLLFMVFAGTCLGVVAIRHYLF